MERATTRTGIVVRLFALVAMAVLAAMAFGTAAAYAAAPAPDDSSIEITPIKPNPAIPGGPGDLVPVPGGGDDPDPCEGAPESERCPGDDDGGGGDPGDRDPGDREDIPTPTRIETGAGGAADDGVPGIGVLIGVTGALGLLAGLARRLAVVREQR